MEISVAISFTIVLLKPFELQNPLFKILLHLLTPKYGCFLEPL